MPSLNEFSFASSNGRNEVYVREWIPDGDAHGVVQIAHGIAEHIARYDDFANYLAGNGFVCVGNDHIGHGKTASSESELGYFGESGGWQLACADMRRLTELEKEKYPELPYVLFGHSMGSFLTRTYIINWRTGLDAVVISGTGQQSPAVVRAGKLLAEYEVKKHGAAYRSEFLDKMAFGSYNDGIAHPDTAYDWLSRDEEQVDKYVADRFCGFMATAGLFRDMMGGIEFIGSRRNLARMKKDLPVYFFSGEADPVGEMGRGVVRAYRKFIAAGMTDVTLKLYPAGRHEMLNELNRGQVYSDVLAWIDDKLKQKSAAASSNAQ